MKLSLLASSMKSRLLQGADVEVTSLHYDSRDVRPGGLFFALRGEKADGHRFLSAAVAAGAAAVVVEREEAIPAGASAVVVSDARLALSLAAATFYGRPTDRVPTVGITGTNGKTTTTYILEGIMAAAGIAPAVLGTVSYRFGTLAIPAPHTTPESADLQRILRELVDAGAKGVVMEVSSHALEQRRVDGCRFDAGIFTNLTPEHLDYHGDMESYRRSKARLFSELLRPDAVKPVRWGVINLDDPSGRKMAEACSCRVVTYGLAKGAAVSAEEVSFSVDGITGRIVTPTWQTDFHSRLLGRFNLYNVLSAAACGYALGLSPVQVRTGIEAHLPVPGRLERVANDAGVTCLVDYAHTGDALENVLRTLADLGAPRIITLFGCGGDRDRSKRPVMGRIAGEFSDFTVVTSDNPRTEDPAAIIAEIRPGLLSLGLPEVGIDALEEGIPGRGFTVVPSRRDAIRLAVRLARPGDILLLAGKGHETYQIIGTETRHFDDREEAAAAFREQERRCSP